MSRNRQALRILWLAGLLLAVFELVVRVPPWHAELAESNFQSNLIRVQRVLFDSPPRAVIAGSSLSGRLLPSYFNGTPLAPLDSLGLDGLSASFALDLILKRPPSVVIIEVNTLLTPVNQHNGELVDAAIHSYLFRLSRYLHVLRAQSRPASMLYSWLKARSRKRANTTASVPSIPPPGPVHSAQLPIDRASDGGLRDRLRAQIQILRDHDCRIVLMRLPDGGRAVWSSIPSFSFGDDLAREFNLVQIDVEVECSRRGHPVSYSDGMHLTAGSAREASQLLAEQLAPAP